MTLPSVKTHPVMVPFIIIVFLLIVIAIIFAAGFATCRLSADTNNLKIVVDDVKVGKQNDDETKAELNANFARAEKLREYEESKDDGCFTGPTPAEWNDFLRPGWFDES